MRDIYNMQIGIYRIGDHWRMEDLTLLDKVLLDSIPEVGLRTSRREISQVLGVAWSSAANSVKHVIELGLVTSEVTRVGSQDYIVLRKKNTADQ